MQKIDYLIMLKGNQKMDDIDKLKENLLKDQKFKIAYENESKRLELALKLVSMRKEAKLSQKELAKRLKTKQSAISRIERGLANITIDMLYKYAEACNMSIDLKVVPK